MARHGQACAHAVKFGFAVQALEDAKQACRSALGVEARAVVLHFHATQPRRALRARCAPQYWGLAGAG